MSATEEAQLLMYEAWDASTTKQRIAMARQALAISPRCADAYVLLAEEFARSRDESLELYRQGVEAGERTLGKKRFQAYTGCFWGVLETRPYMRARAGLAQTLWSVGRHDEAIEHYWAMLRLNPNDNQGIRDLLMPCLIETQRDEEAEKLFRQYKDDGMAVWMYSRALLDFRKHGDSPVANRALEAAIKENRFIPPYLLGRKKLPRRLPGHYGYGDVNEAVLYAFGNQRAWQAMPGAMEWLGTRTA